MLVASVLVSCFCFVFNHPLVACTTFVDCPGFNSGIGGLYLEIASTPKASIKTSSRVGSFFISTTSSFRSTYVSPNDSMVSISFLSTLHSSFLNRVAALKERWLPLSSTSRNYCAAQSYFIRATSVDSKTCVLLA